ncbi:HlyD family efflux transporter periplasmic adaptor subunit [Xylophilus rhododendri]|uniref:HlyD family efflux transporter periplasmic adaptor subunit n=1 Tax=Xylophilus rhododendri TaxID=2697032 RepID=A0A857J9N2_9BURK|nr:efflux RND transporter periplasmic adaptor subunit [Xylophilus rhododendri]QHJ00438.1 HlyD family efflux transporter periplasmic adaptor subunit [Xylophilus rhododendri]
MSCFPRPAIALALALLCAALPAAHAQELKLSPAQLKTLGVEFKPLGAPGDIEGSAYPAQVVLPPANDQVVSAPLPGVIEQIFVTENQAVKAGTPLVRLASPEVGELQLRLMESATQDRLARSTLQREQSLFQEGIVPQRRVQEAQAAAAQSDARLRQAQAALRLAGLDRDSIQRVMAGGEAESAVLVRARSAGIVTQMLAKPGQRVPQTEPLLRVADVSTLWLDIQVPSVRRDAVASAPGTPVVVVGHDARAKLTSASATVSASQTFVLRAEVARGAAQLRPGEYVQVRVPFASQASADGWAVPTQAVVRDRGRTLVFVRSAAGLVATPVQVLAAAGETTRIRGALDARQEIAIGAIAALKSAWQAAHPAEK